MKNVITKVTATEWKNMEAPMTMPNGGIMLIFRGVRKDGTTATSALRFDGGVFAPETKEQNQVFGAWKSVLATFWETRKTEVELKEKNGGIRSKLSAKTPSEIAVFSADGALVKRWDISATVWEKIGLIPTKRDLEASNKEWKTYIHSAAKASFDALKFRINFAEFDIKQKSEKKGENQEQATEMKKAI